MPGWAPSSEHTAESSPESWPCEVQALEDQWIPLPASSSGSASASEPGLRLSCSLWIPRSRVESEQLVVPAVLEYLPYRWGDATYFRDYCRHRYVCGHGFAVVRVDMRGSGDSEGSYHGEYLAQEQEDCAHVLRWISVSKYDSDRKL